MASARFDPADDRNRNPQSPVFSDYPANSLVLLEQHWLYIRICVSIEGPPQVLECTASRYSTSWSTLQEAKLNQERLVHVHDRISLFGSCCRQRIDPYRATIELVDH